MKLSITLPISTRSASSFLPHSPSRLSSISLTMWLGQSGEGIGLVHQPVGVEQRMAGLLDRGLQRFHAVEQDFAHQPHVGLGDQRLVILARHQHGQAQRLPRPVQPVHHQHRDIGRRVRLPGGDLVIDFNAPPTPGGSVKLTTGLGQRRRLLLDDLAGRQQDRHLGGIVHRGTQSPRIFSRPLARGRILQRQPHGGGGQRPEERGARDRLVHLVAQDQRLGVFHIGRPLHRAAGSATPSSTPAPGCRARSRPSAWRCAAHR